MFESIFTTIKIGVQIALLPLVELVLAQSLQFHPSTFLISAPLSAFTIYNAIIETVPRRLGLLPQGLVVHFLYWEGGFYGGEEIDG